MFWKTEEDQSAANKRRRGLKGSRRRRNKKKLEKFNEDEKQRLSIRLISDEGKEAQTGIEGKKRFDR